MYSTCTLIQEGSIFCSRVGCIGYINVILRILEMNEFQENYASGNVNSPIQPLAVFMLQTLKSPETLKVS